MEETKISHTRKRTPGITLIALLLCIQGVLEVVLALVLLLIVTRIPWAVAGFIVSAIIGLVCLALARGLWTLKPWAFGATVVFQILSIVYPLFNFVLVLRKYTFITSARSLICPLLILSHLF